MFDYRLWAVLSAAVFSFALPGAAARAEVSLPKTVYVAVASNFAPPLDVLAKAFTKNTGNTVKASSGSTGKLYAQIKNGGPFDVFLSADAAHVDLLTKEGLAVPASRFVYAVGRLALYAPSLALVDEDTLRTKTITHLAIANPDTAPYGAAAVEALRSLGLWETFKNRMVKGENIAQTFQFVDSGAAEAGFVSLAQVKGLNAKTYWIVPEDRHAPIDQAACLLSAGKENSAARAFLAFLRTDEARTTIESYGYAFEKRATEE